MWLLLVLVAIMAGIAYWDSLQEMVHRWSTSEEYGYGYLIPVITGFLIWQRKNEIAKQEFEFSLLGLILVIISSLVFFMGTIATVHAVAQYAFVLSVLGVALSLLGWKTFRIIAIPLALLFFMIPLPAFIFNNLSSKLQLISSEIGVAVIRLFDISVYLEGNVIDLGSYKLQVVEACSGLRYLFPLMSLSFVAAYIYQGEYWKKILIFLSSMPITVLMNSFRIGIIGVLVEYGGPEQAEGFLHDFEGWVIFMACMAILIGEMYLLGKIGKTRGSLAELFGVEFPEPLPDGIALEKRKLPLFSWSLPIVFLVIVVGVQALGEREKIIPVDRKDFAKFPLLLDGWYGRSDTLESIYLDALKLDDYVLTDYINNVGAGVNFYVAYYGDQVAGEAAHSPRSCIPGGGWQVKSHDVLALDDIASRGQVLMVNRLVIAKGEYKNVVYYWFDQRGRVITNEYMVKWYLFWDLLTKKRSDGALVRLTALLGPGESEKDADRRLQDFAAEVVPLLSEYVPD